MQWVNQWWAKLAVLGVVLTLTACGNRSETDNTSGSKASQLFVSAVVPSKNGNGVGTNALVVATFSAALDPATVTASSFTLRSPTGAVAGTVNASGVLATFKSTENLAANTLYTATLTTAVRDTTGRALATSYTWSFSTGGTVDDTKPQVSATTPSDNDKLVELEAAITATFSEAMNPPTINPETLVVVGPAGAVAGMISYADLTATFTPTTSLDTNTLYTVTAKTIAQDTAGNPLANTTSWAFTTRPWTRLLGALGVGGSSDKFESVVADAAGNIYVTGSTSGGIDYITNAGGTDVIVTKYNAAGKLQWTRQPRTSNSEEGWGIAADSAGNIYVTGFTYGDMSGNNAGLGDVFLTKYDAGGTAQWTRQFGSSANDFGRSIAIDTQDNIYVVGATEGAWDGNSAAGARDIFISKYNTGGTRLWTRQLGTTADEFGAAVAVAANGDIYVTGKTTGGLDGNLNAGGTDIFVAKYNANGSLVWIQQRGSSADDAGWGIAVNAAEEIYITGSTAGGLNGNTHVGLEDTFLLKYNSSGALQWTQQLGTAANDVGFGVALDDSNGILITGYTMGRLAGALHVGDKDIFVAKYTASGVQEWVRSSGTPVTDIGTALVADHQGNIFIAGQTLGALDGNLNAGGIDAFVLKYAVEDGVRRWTRLFGSSANDEATGIAVDSNQNVYLAGYTQGSVDSADNGGGRDAFITKHDVAGFKKWAAQLRTATDEEGWGVAADSSGSVYITGYTQGAFESNTNAGAEDVLLVKYDAAGVRTWLKQFGTTGKDYGKGIAVDAGNNVYITGATAGGLHGNTSSGGQDLFVTKYGADGTRVWTQQLGTAASDAGNAMAVDSGGNVYVVGTTSGSLDGNVGQGGSDLFVVKYDSGGTKQWTRLIGSNANEEGLGVAVDASNNVYVTGSTAGSIDGAMNAGANDILLVKFASDGVKQWVSQFGSTAGDIASGVKVESSDRIYVAGYTSGNLDGLPNSGGRDSFLIKFNGSGVKQWTRLTGTSSDDIALGLAVDTQGTVSLGGYTAGALNAHMNAGERDAFIVTYTSGGAKR